MYFTRPRLSSFITGPRNNEWADLDISMCAQNIMLAAKSWGWIPARSGLENSWNILSSILN